MADLVIEHVALEEIAEYLANMYGSGKRAAFLRALRSRTGDMHTAITAIAYGFKEKDVTPEMREPIKTLLFHLFYGGTTKRPLDAF